MIPSTNLSIVGIGAGIRVKHLSELLAALPPDTGMAFIVVPHREAEHQTLAKLLSKVITMPVTELSPDTAVEPNRIYVTRSGTRKPRSPINNLFRTLAHSIGPRAIGVLLFGTEPDGALGLKTISAAGGITFTQCTVLTPQLIARELSRARTRDHLQKITKEELQATNEELVTLNQQLQEKNLELTYLSDELIHALSNVDIPIVILGVDRRIRGFTPPAEKLLHLLPGDVGQPINHLRAGVNLSHLDEAILQVIQGAGDVWRELEAQDGRWYSVRILPLSTAERRIDGVLITFVDVNELKQSRERSAREHKLITAILNAASNLLVVVLDREGRIRQFNRSAQEVTGYSLDEVKGRLLWDMLPIPDEQAAVRSSLMEVIGGASEDIETHWLTKAGQSRLIAWSNTTVAMDGQTVDYVILTGVDVTDREDAQRHARESDTALLTLLETVPAAILALNPESRIMRANAAAETMFGYKRQEMIGQPVAMLIPERFRQRHVAHVPGFFRKPAIRPMGAGMDLFALRKDGSEFPVDIGLSYIETRAGVLGIGFVSDMTERRASGALLLQNQKELQGLTARLLGLQEAGNKDLSRELHDGLSQKLAALGMEFSTLFNASAQAPVQLPDRVRALSARINGLAGEVHAMSRRLHPAILVELGLEAAIREECVGFSAQEGVPAQFESARIPSSIPEDISLCLYRIVQESLRNVAKHARAANVRVVLSGKKGGIALRVEDTGHGFQLTQVKGKGGLGLISMEERARLVNGDYTVRSKPGEGTIVDLFVPFTRKRNETAQTTIS